MVWIKIWNAEKVQSSTKFKKDWKTGWENAEGWGIQKCPDRCPHAVRTKSVNWYFRCAAGGVWFGILHCVGTLFAGFTHTFCAHSLNHSHTTWTTWEQNAFKTWTIAITEIMMNVKISEIQFSQRKISFQRVWKSANKTLIKEFGCRLNNRAFFSFFLERWNEVKSKWNEMKSNVWLPKWCTPQIIYPGVIRHTKHCAEIFVPLSLRRWIMGCTMGCMQFFFSDAYRFPLFPVFFSPTVLWWSTTTAMLPSQSAQLLPPCTLFFFHYHAALDEVFFHIIFSKQSWKSHRHSNWSNCVFLENHTLLRFLNLCPSCPSLGLHMENILSIPSVKTAAFSDRFETCDRSCNIWQG